MHRAHRKSGCSTHSGPRARASLADDCPARDWAHGTAWETTVARCPRRCRPCASTRGRLSSDPLPSCNLNAAHVAVHVEGCDAMAIAAARPWSWASRTTSALRWTRGNADDWSRRREKVDEMPADERARMSHGGASALPCKPSREGPRAAQRCVAGAASRRRWWTSVSSSAGNIHSRRSSCAATFSGAPTVVTIEK